MSEFENLIANLNSKQKEEFLGYLIILEKQEKLNSQELVFCFHQKDD